MSRRTLRNLAIVFAVVTFVGCRHLGPIALYAGVGGFVIAVVVTHLHAVRAAFLRQAARDIQFEPIADAAVRAEVIALRDALATIGFVVDGPPRRMVPSHAGAIAIPMRHGDKPIRLTLAVIAKKPVRCSMLSVLTDLTGSLATTNESSAAWTVAAPGALRQVFGGMSIEKLLAEHERALAFVGQRGVAIAPVVAGQFDELEAWANRRAAAGYRARPTWHALVFVVRKLTRRSPYTRPIEQQAGASRAISNLRVVT